MADLYPPSYPPRQQQPQPYHPRDSQSYQLNHPPTLSYPAIMSSQQTQQQQQQPQQQQQQQQQQTPSGSLSPDDDHPQKQSDQPTTPKADQPGHSKPQATFLTKLYALLERPENHHMIRWDPAGEYIIVEKPEQLALHVLPSVYRQSRFASFSRQLNIYGFMRKVNLRNVDPAIDDPDASTWSHPTLTRHSPPEVVANFKRRVPPRLPKPKRRETDPAPGPAYPAQRSSNPSMGPVPLPTSSVPQRPPPVNGNHRPRGLSTPGSYSPLNQNGAPTAGWGSTDVFPSVSGPGTMRGTALRPLTVPSDPPMNSHLYSHPGHMQGLSPADETPPSTAGGYGSMPPYSSHGQNRGMMAEPQHQFAYGMTEPNAASSAWTSNTASSHSASLSSLLNPPSQNGSSYPRGAPGPAQMSYPSPFAHGPGQHSPDSRPNTGYSVISAYDETASPTSHAGFDYSRPNSSHHRGVSPGSRPGSSHRVNSGNYGQAGSLSIRRTRRHSQAMSPYPSPYGDDDRPLTANHPDDRAREIGLPRSRSMISINHHPDYAYNPTHAAGDFAYTAGEGDVWPKGTRPGTSASSLSTTTTGSPETGTPPITRGGHPGDYTEADVSRFTPDFGFVSMTDHLPHYNKELD